MMHCHLIPAMYGVRTPGRRERRAKTTIAVVLTVCELICAGGWTSQARAGQVRLYEHGGWQGQVLVYDVFGSIVVVAGNIPGRTLTAAVHVYGQIESQNQAGASAMSLALLALSFSLMLAVDAIQRRRREVPHVAG